MGAVNQLDQLKKVTTVVADTGDFEAISKFAPEDATTNPSLILKAAQMPEYKYIVDEVISSVDADLSSSEQMSLCMDNLAVKFGEKILEVIPGRVSTEVDARLSFDTHGSVDKARSLISQYEKAEIDKNRILIKMASTYEGIRAAEILEKENINCNLTLLFNFTQAVAAADAGAFLISPFVGRILDWYKARDPDNDFSGANDPGVQSVTRIYNYYKQSGYDTVVMGASFRNTSEIRELAGCDRLTISPQLLDELSNSYEPVPTKLKSDKTGAEIKYNLGQESDFRYEVNSDEMATEKLAQGIRGFAADQEKLENWLKKTYK